MKENNQTAIAAASAAPADTPAAVAAANLPLDESKSPEMAGLQIPGRCRPDYDPGRIVPSSRTTKDTEQLLNDMLGECHFLMKEVAFRCILQAVVVEDRLSFLRSAMNCADTGTRVADAVARLRAVELGQARIEDHIAAKTVEKAKS